MTTSSVAADSSHGLQGKLPRPPGLSFYVVVQNAKAAIDFYKSVFGATLVHCFYDPGTTRVVHAILELNGITFYLSDDFPDWTDGSLAPQSTGKSPVTLVLNVADVDAMFDKAVKAGAKALSPVEEQFWGERSGLLMDPFGTQWSIQAHKQDVSFADVARMGEANYRR